MVITAESERTQFCHHNVFVFWPSSHQGEICRWVSCFDKAPFSSTSVSYFVLGATGKLDCSENTHINKLPCTQTREKNNNLKRLWIRSEILFKSWWSSILLSPRPGAWLPDEEATQVRRAGLGVQGSLWESRVPRQLSSWWPLCERETSHPF